MPARADRRAGVFLAVAAIAVLVGVQQFGGVGRDDLLGRVFSNSLHVPLFALIALLLAWILERPRAIRVLAICAGLAAITEIVQIPGPRSASFLDLALDLTGAGLVCGALALGRKRWVWIAALVALTVVTLAAPARIAAAYLSRDRAFPLLLDPGARLLDPLWSSNSTVRRTTPPAGVTFRTDTVLDVVWGPERYPGITLAEVAPDWRGYDQLEVEVFLPQGSPMPLTAAVGYQGLEGTAAHQRRPVAPGYQIVRYAVADLLGASGSPPRLSKLILHTDERNAGRRVLIGTVRLTGSGSGVVGPGGGPGR